MSNSPDTIRFKGHALRSILSIDVGILKMMLEDKTAPAKAFGDFIERLNVTYKLAANTCARGYEAQTETVLEENAWEDRDVMKEYQHMIDLREMEAFRDEVKSIINRANEEFIVRSRQEGNEA